MTHILQTSRIEINSNPNIDIFARFEPERLKSYEKFSGDNFKQEEKLCNETVSAYLNLKHYKKDRMSVLKAKVDKLSSHLEKR